MHLLRMEQRRMCSGPRSSCSVFGGASCHIVHPSPCRHTVHITHRSGKTSVQQVLFNSLPAQQTFYIEKTNRIVKHAYE